MINQWSTHFWSILQLSIIKTDSSWALELHHIVLNPSTILEKRSLNLTRTRIAMFRLNKENSCLVKSPAFHDCIQAFKIQFSESVVKQNMCIKYCNLLLRCIFYFFWGIQNQYILNLWKLSVFKSSKWLMIFCVCIDCLRNW